MLKESLVEGVGGGSPLTLRTEATGVRTQLDFVRQHGPRGDIPRATSVAAEVPGFNSSAPGTEGGFNSVTGGFNSSTPGSEGGFNSVTSGFNSAPGAEVQSATSRAPWTDSQPGVIRRVPVRQALRKAA